MQSWHSKLQKGLIKQGLKHFNIDISLPFYSFKLQKGLRKQGLKLSKILYTYVVPLVAKGSKKTRIETFCCDNRICCIEWLHKGLRKQGLKRILLYQHDHSNRVAQRSKKTRIETIRNPLWVFRYLPRLQNKVKAIARINLPS